MKIKRAPRKGRPTNREKELSALLSVSENEIAQRGVTIVDLNHQLTQAANQRKGLIDEIQAMEKNLKDAVAGLESRRVTEVANVKAHLLSRAKRLLAVALPEAAEVLLSATSWETIATVIDTVNAVAAALNNEEIARTATLERLRVEE